MPWREAMSDDSENAHLCGCHLWTGYTDPKGTPVVRTANSTTTARRAVWEREIGPVPEGLVVMAMCAERLCVRPSHLTTVTTRTLRYRQGVTKRDRYLRRTALRLKMRGLSGREIARRLDVGETTIRRTLAGAYYDPKREKRDEIVMIR